jgi:hypothetical protein
MECIPRQQETYDIRTDICLRIVVAILMTQNMMRLTSDASNAIFRVRTHGRVVCIACRVVLTSLPDAQCSWV